MKTKFKDLKELSLNELIKKENDLRKQLLLSRVARANQQLKNPLVLRAVKRQIARVMTLIKLKGAK
jgi:large subunit ribosomal protein L29